MKVFSIGNLKLGKDTMIFNMGTATDCISKKMGLCKVGEKCYALKAERMYKDCIPYRERQGSFWKVCSPQEFINQLVLEKTSKIKYFRFNEAGDFSTQKDVDKLSKIALTLKKEYGIVTYGYTARKDLDFSSVNFIVNGSSFMAHNNFKYIPKDHPTDMSLPVCPGSCKTCNLCKENNGLTIQINQH